MPRSDNSISYLAPSFAYFLPFFLTLPQFFPGSHRPPHLPPNLWSSPFLALQPDSAFQNASLLKLFLCTHPFNGSPWTSRGGPHSLTRGERLFRAFVSRGSLTFPMPLSNMVSSPTQNYCQFPEEIKFSLFVHAVTSSQNRLLHTFPCPHPHFPQVTSLLILQVDPSVPSGSRACALTLIHVSPYFSFHCTIPCILVACFPLCPSLDGKLLGGKDLLFLFLYRVSSTKQHSENIISIQRNACEMNTWMNE